MVYIILIFWIEIFIYRGIWHKMWNYIKYNNIIFKYYNEKQMEHLVNKLLKLDFLSVKYETRDWEIPYFMIRYCHYVK